MAVAQRFDRRLDDEIRRAEVGLADAEIDDVAAGGDKMHGARQHGKGVLFADAVEGGDGFQHSVPPAVSAHDPEKWKPVFPKRSCAVKRQFNPTIREMQMPWP